MALFDTTAERAVLGALMIQASDGWEPELRVRPEMFTQREIGEAVSAYMQLRAQRRPANLIAVGAVTGNSELIGECIRDAPNSAMLDEYEAQVIEAARRRRLVELAQRAARVAHDDAADLDHVLPAIADDIASLRRTPESDDVAGSIERESQATWEWVEDKTRLLGRTTGISILDRYSDGLRPELYVIGARPGMGKSSLMTQCLDGQTTAGMHVFCATLEMSIGRLASRIAFQRMQIAKEQLNVLNRNAWIEHMASVRDNPNVTWYSGARSRETDDIVAAILDAHRRRPLDVVWIDHLGYINHRGDRGETKASKIGNTTKSLASLTHKLGIPVMLLCQLNREAADGAPPVLTDLRESGEIEQDARHVWMLHRPGYYDDVTPAAHVPQQYEIWIRKAQDAGTGHMPLMWRADCARIYPRQHEVQR